MTALVVLALAWLLLALSVAFVVGHGIRLADACAPCRQAGDDSPGTAHERQAVQAA